MISEPEVLTLKVLLESRINEWRKRKREALSKDPPEYVRVLGGPAVASFCDHHIDRCLTQLHIVNVVLGEEEF